MTAAALPMERIDDLFRQMFREELPERVRALEDLLEQLAQGAGDDIFQALCRGVHNIKGNAASFGLHGLVSVCHRLEDLFNDAPAATRTGDSAFRRGALALVDLMPMAAGEGDDLLERVEAAVGAIAATVRMRPRRAMIVGDSRSTLLLVREVVQGRGFEVVQARDGYLALHRLLTEPFAILISTGETELMRGEALVAALRLSASRNRNMITVVLTSATGSRTRQRQRNSDPDYILGRDQRLAAELEAILGRLQQ